MASEVIIEIFDKSSLVKTDSNWLFKYLSFVFCTTVYFTIDDTPE